MVVQDLLEDRDLAYLVCRRRHLDTCAARGIYDMTGALTLRKRHRTNSALDGRRLIPLGPGSAGCFAHGGNLIHGGLALRPAAQPHGVDEQTASPDDALWGLAGV
jgi:hypothetical protein